MSLSLHLSFLCRFIPGCTTGAWAPEEGGVGEEEARRAPDKEGTGAGWYHQTESKEKESGDGAGGCGEWSRDTEVYFTATYRSHALFVSVCPAVSPIMLTFKCSVSLYLRATSIARSQTGCVTFKTRRSFRRQSWIWPIKGQRHASRTLTTCRNS